MADDVNGGSRGSTTERNKVRMSGRNDSMIMKVESESESIGYINNSSGGIRSVMICS